MRRAPSADSETYTHHPDPPPDRIYDEMGVALLTTLHRSYITRMSREGEFPRPVVLGKNRIGWRQSDIMEWVASRPTVGEAPWA